MRTRQEYKETLFSEWEVSPTPSQTSWTWGSQFCGSKFNQMEIWRRRWVNSGPGANVSCPVSHRHEWEANFDLHPEKAGYSATTQSCRQFFSQWSLTVLQQKKLARPKKHFPLNHHYKRDVYKTVDKIPQTANHFCFLRSILLIFENMEVLYVQNEI